MDPTPPADSPQEYFGRVFGGPGSEPHRSATLRIRGGHLELRWPDGTSHDLTQAEITAQLGGDSRDQLVLQVRPPGEEVWSLYLEDWRALEALKRVVSPTLPPSLAQVEQERQAERRRGRRWWLGVLGGALVLGWLLLRSLDVAADLVVERIPAAWEIKWGELAVEQAVSGRTKVADPVVVNAVETVGNRLVQALENPPYAFRYRVVVAPEVNALALPGGQVVVFTGLLAAAEAPEEVAGVLAHEMQHVLRRHGLKNVARRLGTKAILGALLGDESLFYALVEQSADQLLSSQFSRKQETEADLRGVELLRRAAVDPRGFVAFFERLAAQESQLEAALSWVSTHPPSARRARQLRQAIAASTGPEVRPFKLDWEEVWGRIQGELGGTKGN